jgi:muramidase (phage lysozyme)
MANLVPYSKSSIIKPKQSAIIKADKFLNAKTKSTKVNENSVKPKQSKNSSEDIILQIEKKVIKIDKLLKDSFALKMNQQKKSTIKEEQKEFENREKELEKKKPKKEPGINLPTLPKMGFIDWIKNFVFNTILGFLAVRLIKFLPTLLKIYPVIIGAGEFLINVGGNLLNSLVSFVDWGYKAVDATSGFIKSIGGEGLSKVFDNFTGAVDNVLEFAVMAALLSSGGDDESGGLGGKGGKRGYDSQGRRVGKNVQQRYERRFGKDKFVDRFGTKNLKNVAQGARRGAFQQGTRNAFVGLAGKGGAKSILKFVRPLTNKLPIIGGLLNFGLSVALGEDPGRAAFKAIGSTLVGALGAAIGSLAFGVGGIIGGIIGGIGGDALGGALYDMFFKGKKPTQKQGKTNKLAGGGSPIPPTRGGKSSSSTPKRTLKKKKSTKTLTFNPRKIHPGRSAGGEAKVQSVFPNPEKKAWWDPLGVFTGKKQEQQPQQKKPKGKTANPQEFLIKSNDIFGRAKGTAGKMISGFSTYIIKSLLGDVPDDLDYLNLSKGLNSFMREIFEPGTLGFAGGGEVDARQFFEGKDYTKVIAKSVKESGSKEVDTIVRNLRNEMSLGPVDKKETENTQPPPSEIHLDQGATSGSGTADTSLNPYRRAFLDTLAYAEGTGNYPNTGYNTMFTGKQFSGFKDHPRKIQVSGRYRSDAAGRYQFLSTTWDGLGLSDFSPANQDKGALKLLASHVLQAIDKGDFATAFHGARKTWASLPGAGYGQPEKKMKTLVGYANNRLEKYKKGQIGKPVDEPSGRLGPLPGGVTSQKMRTGPSAYIGGSADYHIDTKFHKSLGMSNMVSAVDKLANAYSSQGRKIEFSNSGVAGRVWNPGASSDEKRNLLQKAIDAHSHSRFMRSEGFLPFDYYIPKKNETRFGKSAEGAEILLPTFGGKTEVGTKYGGYGKSAEIFGSSGKMVAMTGHADIRYAKGGKTLDGPHEALIGEEGTEYVIDNKSFETTEKFLPGLLDILNYKVNDKASLIKYLPNIISSLSQYTYYGNPNQEPQYIIIKSLPEIVYVPTGSSGRNVFISGGVNNNNGMEATLTQVG